MPRPIDHIDIDDIKALTAHQRGKEAVQPVEIGHHQEHLAPESLQPAAGVAGTVFQDRIADGIGRTRRDRGHA